MVIPIKIEKNNSILDTKEYDIAEMYVNINHFVGFWIDPTDDNSEKDYIFYLTGQSEGFRTPINKKTYIAFMLLSNNFNVLKNRKDISSKEILDIGLELNNELINRVQTTING